MTDELMERYTRLSNQTVFNPATYSQEWYNLADDFDKAGRPSMAASVRGRGDWYTGVGRGYAQQLRYSEITRVSAHYQRSDPDERMLECDVCGTWTKHVRCEYGWSCGLCGDMIWLYTNKGSSK